MEALEGLGLVGAIIVFFWVIAGIFVPFFIWGIYNHAQRISREVIEIRKILKNEVQEVVVVEKDENGFPVD